MTLVQFGPYQIFLIIFMLLVIIFAVFPFLKKYLESLGILSKRSTM